MRTRIKICGLTRAQDVREAVAAGADAIGFVFYPQSSRAVTIAQARELVALLPPFVTAVGLFVNATEAAVREVLAEVPLGLLQFHGDEDAAFCARFGRAWMKAARVRAGFDLLDYAARFPGASGLLVDAWVEGYGGGGEVFDWNLLPAGFSAPLVLAGGLTPANVTDAVRRVRPWAVDVSSGVEQARGIKDPALMRAFVAGVRKADEPIQFS
ncbi:MAG: phosphoribosylanthranilate isomerase [Candidatus Dactylopiibacterium sp.]|nr:phosphoribosylanthranilate isomerase [Candidatus Dactylopiibacterium sp.]